MKKILLLLCLFCSLNIFAQHTIIGNIVERNSKIPVDFGYIVLYHDNVYYQSTTPDEHGNFNFEKVMTDNYRLEIKIIGYAIQNRNIAVSGDMDLGIIELLPEYFELEEVGVIGKKRQVVYRLDKKVISATANIVAGSGGNATDILSKIPSVRVDANGDISFRGSSGFLIHVNGKPSMFNAAQALQQIPADQIENIEIITTPSARNQTDGDAGIINIITKQNYDEGISGAVNAFGSTYGSRGVDFTINKKSGKHRFTIGGIYGQRMRKSDFEQEKTTIVADTTVTSHSKGPRKGEHYSYILQAGWQLTKEKTDFYVDLTGGYEGRKNKGNLAYSENIRKPGILDAYNEYNSRDDYDLHETLFSGSAGFDHKFNNEGHTLNGYVYVKYGGDALEHFTSNLYDKNGNREQGHQAWEDEHRWTIDARLDYVYPYSTTGRIETGYQYFSYLEDGDYRMDYWNPAIGQFENREDIYNTFYFQRGINTIYLLGNQQIGKFEIQAGIRGEHTHQVLESSKKWADRTQNRFEFFPSVHAGYNPNETISFTAAYSRRTNRPELFCMEPYITFRDYYTAEIGNPDIRPEYINSYELTFKKNLGEKTLQVAAFHRARRDKIERLRIPYESGITLDSMANVGSDYTTGIEVGLTMQPIKIWSLTFNGDIYHYKIKNKLLSSGKNQSSTNYSFSLNNNVQLGKKTAIQLDGSYVGPTVRTQGRQEGFFYADLAVRQQFTNRFSAGLSFRNFLNTAKYRSSIDSDNLVSNTTIWPKYPLITLNLSYTFNNFKQKTKGREGSDFFEGVKF